eukprot:TRINITY_DN50165_c0_g1_i1.p1 TRINITY_DN50165_c0_g1~~TRINITY_DN50165_c0_g1_i1.p1  ORF type:complete len:390 (-),score=81.40 TRINITY_DN50165_c0_g1_i1:240-1358(-)
MPSRSIRAKPAAAAASSSAAKAKAKAKVKSKCVKEKTATATKAERCITSSNKEALGQASPSDEAAKDVSSPGLSDILASVADCAAPGKEAAAQQAALHAVASQLLNHFDLWIGGQPHRIVELEAYVHGPGHMDPYTHSDDDQLNVGRWYFHKMHGTFKAGTYKGLDLTCGSGSAADAEHPVRAGLLLRAVMSHGGASAEIVEGPSLVVDRILKLCGKPSIASFVEGRSASDLCAASTKGLYLQRASQDRPDAAVWRAPRVGLVLRSDEDGKTHSSGVPSKYIARFYRFSTLPHKLKKYRAGFAAAGVVQSVDETGTPTMTAEALKASLQLPKAAEYVEATRKGLTSKCLERFVDMKNIGQADLCVLVGACHG